MGSSVVTVRAAEPADYGRLRELMAASKAHWGYDRDVVRAWAEGLRFDETCERWVADCGGKMVAWTAVIQEDDGVAVLEDLWVDPGWLGRGIGTQLFRHAAERARTMGARKMRWEADPNAAGFYERMGATTLGSTTSSWDREVPLMEIRL